MEYKLHKNGWTVFLGNFDFANATQAQADDIARLVSTNVAVVAQGSNVENLTPEDQVKFCSMMGHLEEYHDDTAWGRAIALSNDEIGNKIQRVTGAVNDEGHPGLFGHDEELDWHNNTPWDPKRKPVVFLKSLSGAEGSRTSWTNTQLAYEDLKKEDPAFIAELEAKNYRIVCGWHAEGGHTTMYSYWSEFGELDKEVKNDESAMPLVFTNESGRKGFYLPFLQTFSFYGMTREQSLPILERIWNYCLQEKYMYHHDWIPGGSEVVIAEQWLSTHKRNEFAGMKTRFMQRSAVDYTNTTWWADAKPAFSKQITQALRQNIRDRISQKAN
jgi:alpha-ketoglutarate-dependent taurine dioxygenase